MAERNWGSNGGATTGATTGARTAYEEFAKNYNGAFLVAIGLAIVITFFEVMFSKAGGAWSIVNYWIGWGCLAAWAFLVFHPKGPGPVLFLAVMGFNAPWNELDDILTKLKLPDFKLKEMGEKGWEFLRMKYFVLAGHVALYLVLQSMVLATFDVSHGALVPGALLGLAGFGLWVVLLTKAHVWYTRIVFLTLFVTTGYAIAGTFAPEPSKVEQIETAQEAYQEQIDDNALTPILRKAENGFKLTDKEAEVLQKAKEREAEQSILKKVEKLLPQEKRTVPLTLKSFKDNQEMCFENLPAGKWRWKFAQHEFSVQHLYEPQVYQMIGALFINNTSAGEEVDVRTKNGKGCIFVNFPSYPEETQKLPISPNTGLITFY